MDLEAALRRLNQRAKTDEAFRQEFERDPEGVLQRETGLPLDDLWQLAAELSDAELAAVTGGTAGRTRGSRCPQCQKWVRPGEKHTCVTDGASDIPGPGMPGTGSFRSPGERGL
ncbi:MAG TPA: hypothetical protein VIK93_10475 [Limnochordales bacterium]